VLFALCFLTAVASRAQQTTPPQDQQSQQPPDQSDQVPAGAGLSADEIIQILQQNPDLLAEAKQQILAALRDRGYPVSASDITDQRLFDEIQSDDRVRQVMSDQLQQRGFGAPEAAGQQTPAKPVPGQQAGRGQGANASQSGRQRPAGARTGVAQGQYPFRDLPALRDLYAPTKSAQAPLERFGAALFRNSEAAGGRPLQDVPIGPDYVIGPGDELLLQYWGASSQRANLKVDQQGRVVLPEAGALMLAGHSLADAQQMVQSALSRQLRGISVDLSLAKLRNVRIYVVGDVKNPGAYDISALSTPLSALLTAGGPTDTGSFRLVRHLRGKRLVEETDLYDLMLKGVSSAQTALESGDSILVPPVGPQVTVSGAVRRPGIYELRTEQTLDQVLDLAGGVPVSGELRKIRVQRTEAHEQKEMVSVEVPPNSTIQAAEASFKNFAVKDGDSITVSSILPYNNRTVYLMGHVFQPGAYPYRDGIKVTDLVSSFKDLQPEPADRAEIIHLSPPDYRPVVTGFNLRDVLENRAPAPGLQPFDTVRVFGRYERDAPKVSVYGEVLRPGEYPLSDRMSAADLLRMAGGFKRSAYTQTADLASYDVANGEKVELQHREIPISRALAGDPDTDVLLKPGDVLTIRQLGGWNDIGGAITVSGEVLHPGRYGVEQGEHLSSILKRAGGLLSDAYTYAAVLDRAQVREAAVRSRDEMIQKLQEQGMQGNRLESLSATRERQQLVDRLKEIQPSGRLIIHISSDISKWENTSNDIEVRPGDTLIIPKRPDFVLVAGQVYNPTAITFRGGRRAEWYLKQAGGPTTAGDRKNIFVVRADGSVVGTGSRGWWSGGALDAVLQPGDTIFVPDKVGGSGIFKNFGQTVQILSGVAIAVKVVTGT